MKRNHKYPWCYVPFFVGSEIEMKELLNGHLILSPLISRERYASVINSLPYGYNQGMGIDEQINLGYIISQSEFKTVGRSLYPLEYTDEHYVPIDKRYLELGDYALIVLYPSDLLRNINAIFSRLIPHLYEAQVMIPSYVDKPSEDNFTAIEVDKQNEWKKELLLFAEFRHDIAIGAERYPDPMKLDIGMMEDIAVLVSVKDLVDGNYPSEILEPKYIKMLNSIEPKESEITGYHKSFMAEVMEIDASKKWIDKLSVIFAKDKWIPVAFSEKLRPDGASMARLSYDRLGSQDCVRIGINQIDFNFYKYGDVEKKIVSDLIDFVFEETGKRFAGLKVSIEADLGLRDDEYSSYLHLDESFSVKSGNLFNRHSLFTDSRYCSGIFGQSVHKFSWHYAIEVFTPPYESIRWYSADQVKSFFSKHDKVCMEYISVLQSSDDPYEAFQALKSRKGILE